MDMTMSQEVQTALINARPGRGWTVMTDAATLTQLQSAGLVKDVGLTCKGIVARERLITAALDAAF